MSDQKLDGQEVLNVRWAYDDPNPKVRKQASCNFTLLATIGPCGIPPLHSPHPPRRGRVT